MSGALATVTIINRNIVGTRHDIEIEKILLIQSSILPIHNYNE